MFGLKLSFDFNTFSDNRLIWNKNLLKITYAIQGISLLKKKKDQFSGQYIAK